MARVGLKAAVRSSTCAIVLFAATSASAVTLEVVPALQSVPEGAGIEVRIKISGLVAGLPPSIGIFDVSVTFDETVLGFIGATYGDLVLGDQLDLSGLGSTTVTTLGVGVVGLFELSFDSPDDLNTLQAAEFVLVRVTVEAMAPGSSAIGLAITSLGDALGEPVEADITPGSVVVTPGIVVPSPPAYLLTLLGVVVLLGRCWRRKYARG